MATSSAAVAQDAWHDCSWEGLVQDERTRQDNALTDPKCDYNMIDYLKLVFPGLALANYKLLECAFAIVAPAEMVEVYWENPMCPISLSDRARYAELLFPDSQWTAMNYHSCNAFRLPSIRRLGLLPSASGAMSTVPRLYASPLRKTCMSSYGRCAYFPQTYVRSQGQGAKEFFVLLGLTGEPNKRIKRRRGNLQVLYTPRHYIAEIVQFVCLSGAPQLFPTEGKHFGKRKNDLERLVRGAQAFLKPAWLGKSPLQKRLPKERMAKIKSKFESYSSCSLRRIKRHGRLVRQHARRKKGKPSSTAATK